MTEPGNRWWRATLLAPWIALTAAAQADADALSLRPQLLAGQKLFFVETTRQQVDIETPYQPTRQSLEVARTMMVEVLEVAADGSSELALAVLRVHGEVGLPLGDKRPFDTFDPTLAQDPKKLAGLGAAVRSRIGEADKLLVLRADPRGAVIGDLSAAPQVEGQEPLEPAQQARLKRVVAALFARAPQTPVRVGASWEHALASGDPALPTVQRTNVTLARAEPEQLTLRLSGTIRTDAALATPNTIKVDGQVSGVQRIDRRGVVVATSLRAEADVEVPGMDELPARMKLESSLRRATSGELAALRDRVKASLDRAEQQARRAKSEADVRVLAGAVRMFYAKNGKLPPDLDALVGAELAEVPLDAWGNPYELVRGSAPQGFYVRTHGPDGEPGTADDVTSRKTK
ncbi:MAG: type II secretion system protein GspG [Planctomycetota bacterium]